MTAKNRRKPSDFTNAPKSIGDAIRQNTLSAGTRRKLSEARRGKKLTPKHCRKLSEIRRGRKFTAEHRRKIGEAQRGEKGNGWKGGITPLYALLRTSAKYAEWRQNVFLRDDFTCRKCGEKTSGNFHAHHKKSLSTLAQEARTYLPLFTWYEACLAYTPLWDTDNGITLCVKCHMKLHKRRKM